MEDVLESFIENAFQAGHRTVEGDLRYARRSGTLQDAERVLRATSFSRPARVQLVGRDCLFVTLDQYQLMLCESSELHVLEESWELANEDAQAHPARDRIAQCHTRFELSGGDDFDIDYFHDYGFVLEALEGLGTVCIFDQADQSFMEPGETFLADRRKSLPGSQPGRRDRLPGSSSVVMIHATSGQSAFPFPLIDFTGRAAGTQPRLHLTPGHDDKGGSRWVATQDRSDSEGNRLVLPLTPLE